MGLIINPRGTSGSGKTCLVRRIMADLRAGGAEPEPLYRPGRERPIACRFAPAAHGRPVLVLGHYERTRGGCDTIPRRDGGLDEAFRLADAFADQGYGVVMEGLELSGEHRRTAALAQRHDVRVIRLGTSFEDCIRNVLARRGAGRGAVGQVIRTAAGAQQALEAACAALEAEGVAVETLAFDAALNRARMLLGLAERVAREAA